MRRNMSLIYMAAVLGLALLPSAARAVTTVVYRFQNHAATATFSGLDETGCIYTVSNVSIYEARTQVPPGSPQPSAFVSVYVYRYDSCRKVWILDGDGAAPVEPSAFEFGGGLQSARGKVQVTLHDYVSNGPVQLSLDLAWTGDGDTYHGASHSNFWYPQYGILTRSMGSSREARAVGTILVGGTNVVTGGSSVAELTWGQYGTVTRIR